MKDEWKVSVWADGTADWTVDEWERQKDNMLAARRGGNGAVG